MTLSGARTVKLTPRTYRVDVFTGQQWLEAGSLHTADGRWAAVHVDHVTWHDTKRDAIAHLTLTPALTLEGVA